MAASDIFGGKTRFTRYHAEVQVRDFMVGGIPKDPDTIKGWLKARLDLGDRELVELANEISDEMRSAGERTTADGLLDAVMTKVESGNGFKRVDGQLVYEGRCMKGALKEAANVAYPGNTYPGQKGSGRSERKGLMNTLAETVFVEDQHIGLGVPEPTLTEQRIKHLKGPKGPYSTINVVDLVAKPHLSFTVRVLDDFITREVWGSIWETLENIGIGADRARSDGKFDLVAWEPI